MTLGRNSCDGGPRPEAERNRVAWVLSEGVGALLAAAKSAQIPLRGSVKGPESKTILGIDQFRAMTWDAARVGANLEARSSEFSKRFGGG